MVDSHITGCDPNFIEIPSALGRRQTEGSRQRVYFKTFQLHILCNGFQIF